MFAVSQAMPLLVFKRSGTNNQNDDKWLLVENTNNGYKAVIPVFSCGVLVEW
jgi:hypothetical protein